MRALSKERDCSLALPSGLCVMGQRWDLQEAESKTDAPENATRLQKTSMFKTLTRQILL